MAASAYINVIVSSLSPIYPRLSLHLPFIPFSQMQKIYRETTQTRYSIGTSATSQRCQNKQANMLFDQQTYI